MDEYHIVERVKDWYRTASIKEVHNFILNDTTIISIESYERSYDHNPSISKQVTGYVNNDETISISTLEFPMLQWKYIPYAYLYKKGYVVTGDRLLGPDPLPNLKYVIYCISRILGYEFQDRLVIELVDVDVAANNLNLPKIISSVLGPELLRENVIIEYDELDKIEKRMSRQKLFADHTLNDAEYIVHQYFDRDERELSKEVLKISEAYQRVFRPYRVVYNTKTWQPVLV